MAGLEVVVRPVVFPAIRPAPARPLAPQDDPEKGVAVLSGLGGKLIDLTFSESSSWSRSKAVEVQRTVTTQRVKQKKPDGTVNEENYVDVDHVTDMTMREGDGTLRYEYYSEPPEAPNIETIEVNKTIRNPDLPPEDAGKGP